MHKSRYGYPKTAFRFFSKADLTLLARIGVEHLGREKDYMLRSGAIALIREEKRVREKYDDNDDDMIDEHYIERITLEMVACEYGAVMFALEIICATSKQFRLAAKILNSLVEDVLAYSRDAIAILNSRYVQYLNIIDIFTTGGSVIDEKALDAELQDAFMKNATNQMHGVATRTTRQALRSYPEFRYSNWRMAENSIAMKLSEAELARMKR